MSDKRAHFDTAVIPAEALGFGDGLIRLSGGIEDADDLIDDLKQAIERSKQA